MERDVHVAVLLTGPLAPQAYGRVVPGSVPQSGAVCIMYVLYIHSI